MLNKVKNRKEQGFTIIEVLIVLAIAGLILLIVFLAVPALQRNSRNTQRRNEVAATVGAVGEYVSNNNGKLPTASAAFNTAFTGSNVDFRTYTAANVTYDYSATARGAAPTITNLENVVVYNFLKCNGSLAVTAGASARSIAALYMVEGSGGAVQQCVES